MAKDKFLIITLALRTATLSEGLKLRASLVASGLAKALGLKLHGTAAPGVFLHGRLRLVRLNGLWFAIRPGTTDLYIATGAHEPNTGLWFQPRKGDVVIDVGAHIGRYTLLAAGRGAKVFSVEPEPDNFRLLLLNISLNRLRGIVPLNCALASSCGLMRLYSPAFGDKDRTSFSATWPQYTPRAFTVPCRSLDDLAEEFMLDRVDWLKVDVEGAETQVLMGGLRTLRKVRRLIIEITDRNATECLRLLKNAGLRVVAIMDRFEDQAVSNWLAVRA